MHQVLLTLSENKAGVNVNIMRISKHPMGHVSKINQNRPKGNEAVAVQRNEDVIVGRLLFPFSLTLKIGRNKMAILGMLSYNINSVGSTDESAETNSLQLVLNRIFVAS